MPFGPAQAETNFTIEVYPFEGGVYTIQGGQITQASVGKSIAGISPGSFEIELAPGGPNGVEGAPTWSEIITPQSFVLIGGQRGTAAAIIMAGVVTECAEAQQWRGNDQGATASRRQVIYGQDFTWYFNSFNFYALTFFGVTQRPNVPVSFPSLVNQGFTGGSSTLTNNPAILGKQWYTDIMAGSGAILGQTYIPYQFNTQLSFLSVVTQIFEPYSNLYIPMGDYYWAAEGSWSAKFAEFFPAPYYEFFITTAPSGAYAVSVSGDIGAGYGHQFAMKSLPAASGAGPVLVARVNPTPTLLSTAAAQGATPVISPGVDVSRWKTLALYDFTSAPYGFFNSTISFSSDGARNFYYINPTYARPTFGDSNSNIAPFVYYFNGAGDTRSIHRYGYRPEIGTIRWLSDLQGNAAQGPSADTISQTVAMLTAKLASWFQPLPLMARAKLAIPFAPDILPGNRFRYSPFKGQPSWDFYIEAFEHSYVFGGVSSTTLTLSRGLPTEVYADAAKGSRLEAVHLGTAIRLNGIYSIATGAAAATPALTPFASPESVQAFLGNLAAIYVTPQSK